jgi:hypothetical protein
MPKYLYILSAEKPFIETELNRIKDEICRLFECTDLSVSEGKVFTFQSPFGPRDVQHLAAEASKRFRMHLTAGGKVD